AVGVFFAVCEQRQCCLLAALAPTAGGNRFGDAAFQILHFAVDDDCVQAFFSAEVFVHHRFGHLGAGGDIFHAGAIESLFRECRTPNGNQLLATLLTSHPLSCHGYSLAKKPTSPARRPTPAPTLPS